MVSWSILSSHGCESMSGCRQPSRSTQRQYATEQWFSKSGPGSAASVSAGNQLDMQILRSTLDLWSSRFREWGPAFSVWTSLPDNCDKCIMCQSYLKEKSPLFPTISEYDICYEDSIKTFLTVFNCTVPMALSIFTLFFTLTIIHLPNFSPSWTETLLLW